VAGLLEVSRARWNWGALSRAPATQGGVSLIEFLVVLVIITIGLLSVAGMLAFGIRQDTETLYRAVAASQAKNLAERMHANLVGAVSGFYLDTPNALTACPTGTSATRCQLARDLALADRAAWNTATSAALPPVAAPSTGTSVALVNGVHVITIRWTENARVYADNAIQGTVTATTVPTVREAVFRYNTIPEVFAR
jgi:type IV pilus assembly protein PilV